MRIFLSFILSFGFSLAGLLACSNRNGSRLPDFASHFNLDWAQHKLWDDGFAEVAIYDAQRVVYNKPRYFEYTLITVKEDFNRAFDVKTDDYKRKDLFPVIKVNEFARIPTDQYPYHYLTSLFFRRENPVTLHKLSGSSQEWCGNTFKAVSDAGSSFKYTYHSYWDGQGDGKRKLDKNTLFEDQLPYTLRSLAFAEGLTFQAPVYELQQTSKATEPQIYPTGAWLVTVQFTPEKQSRYWFAREYPNILLRQQSFDGRTLILKNVRRYAYWQH